MLEVYDATGRKRFSDTDQLVRFVGVLTIAAGVTNTSATFSGIAQGTPLAVPVRPSIGVTGTDVPTVTFSGTTATATRSTANTAVDVMIGVY